ncbi:hypothetical protein [Treponema primitia]|uniref:hypothetical protein n=1 Tax=Treponema primitia TaxID=88058 RepID=UPI000255593A|nr:hypothetical protein [Treponema primitia]
MAEGKGETQGDETPGKQSPLVSMVTIMASPILRGPGIQCIRSIFLNFFFLQYKAVLFPGRIPVTSVDHPLDAKIPFIPRWVNIYLDFVAFWIRILGFLLKHYGRRALKPVKDFLNSMNRLYQFSAEVYSKNMSTTRRPYYIARPRFFLIHLTDPHLMCIPSLHVMVMILSYTRFRDILRSFGDEEALAGRIDEINSGAALITEAILYVKQHSVNCVAAAMYAMSRFDPAMFPPEEAEVFVARLFTPRTALPGLAQEDGAIIRDHIITLYRRFMADSSDPGEPWEAPLIRFLEKNACRIDKKV